MTAQQVFGYRSPVQCPFQVYGLLSSSYLVSVTSFTVLGTCLIATATAQEHHFIVTLGGIVDPMALQSSTLASSKTTLPLRWESHLAPSRVPWPAPMVQNTTRKCPRSAKCNPRTTTSAPRPSKCRSRASKMKTNPVKRASKTVSRLPEIRGQRQGAKPLGYIYIYIYIYICMYIDIYVC